MEDFLRRAAADLHIGVEQTSPTTWTLTIPGSLARVFGKETVLVTTDKQVAALDPDLQLLSPNSSLTLRLAEQLRSRGRPTHRARLEWYPDQAALLADVQEAQLIQGSNLQLSGLQQHIVLRITFRIRFEREVIEEKMVACCVDYETGQVWPTITDITNLRDQLTPLPSTGLTDEHVNVALHHARRWLERLLYPQKALHEAQLAQLLAVEKARINAFYDALEEDSGLALGAKEGESNKQYALEEERKRLLDEQEYRYALSLAAETVSVATIQTPVLHIGSKQQPHLIAISPLFEPMIQLPHCQTCGRQASLLQHKEQLVCNVCHQVLAQ